MENVIVENFLSFWSLNEMDKPNQTFHKELIFFNHSLTLSLSHLDVGDASNLVPLVLVNLSK